LIEKISWLRTRNQSSKIVSPNIIIPPRLFLFLFLPPLYFCVVPVGLRLLASPETLMAFSI
jgi:hypothetical protein